jgi:hypothetical protein
MPSTFSGRVRLKGLVPMALGAFGALVPLVPLGAAGSSDAAEPLDAAERLTV